MRSRLIPIGAAIVVLVGLYLAGLLPERSRRLASETRAAELQVRVDQAEGRLRVDRLLGELLMVEEVVVRRNYGQAQELSSALFDRVAEEASRPHDAGIKAALDELRARRDVVTAALARTDPAVSDTLHELEVRLRAGLGYPVP